MSKQILDIKGKTYGILTVLSRAENGSYGKVRWLCKCKCGNEIIVNGADLKNERVHSCGCVDENEFKIKPKKKNTKHMSVEDREKWNELYEYVRTNVMDFDKNTSLNKNMVLRLKGLLTGNVFANNKTKNNANYSYDVVINTFKFCYLDIQRAKMTKEFETDMKKFNYILAIVSNNLSTVYERMKDTQKANKELEEDKDLEYVDLSKKAEFSDYQKRTQTLDKKKADKFEEYW